MSQRARQFAFHIQLICHNLLDHPFQAAPQFRLCYIKATNAERLALEHIVGALQDKGLRGP